MAAPHVEPILNSFIIIVWLVIAGYFFRRYLKFQKTVSLALVGMSLGWLTVGLADQAMDFLSGYPVKVVAIVMGCFVGYSIWSIETKEQ